MQTYSYKPPGRPSHISKGRIYAGRHALKLTWRQPVRCSLSPHVISGTIATATLYCAAATGLMIAAPRAHLTARIISTDALFLPLALAYTFLLAHSWQADTLQLILPGTLQEGLSGGFNPQFFPKLHGIMSLFSRVVTAASLWVHLLAINLFSARTIIREGIRKGHAVRHSLILGSAFGPLGLLSNAATRRLSQQRSSDAVSLPTQNA